MHKVKQGEEALGRVLNQNQNQNGTSWVVGRRVRIKDPRTTGPKELNSGAKVARFARDKAVFNQRRLRAEHPENRGSNRRQGRYLSGCPNLSIVFGFFRGFSKSNPSSSGRLWCDSLDAAQTSFQKMSDSKARSTEKGGACVA